jgi:pimeloyl-ACP methyl ester carboxylesterase
MRSEAPCGQATPLRHRRRTAALLVLTVALSSACSQRAGAPGAASAVAEAAAENGWARASSGFVKVGEAQLYYEVHGEGPPLVFIPGGFGVAASAQTLVPVLARYATVIAYDRLGHGQSTAPPGWTKTSVGEAADDVAAIIEALGAAPVTVFSTSAGTAIGLELALRHPRLLRGLILHESTLGCFRGGVKSPAGPAMYEAVKSGMAEGGPALAMERLSHVINGVEFWQRVPEPIRARLFENGATYFDIDQPATNAYCPDDEKIRSLQPPMELWLGREPSPLTPTARAVADYFRRQLGVSAREVPGAHFGFWDHPEPFAVELRDALARLAGQGHPPASAPAD